MKLTITFILIVLFPFLLYSQWLDIETIKTTVLIEKMKDNKLNPHGVGFLLYNYDNPGRYVVVTCAHVLKSPTELFVRMNLDSTISRILNERKINTVVSEKEGWFSHQNNLIIKINLQNSPSKTFVVSDSLDIGAFYLEIPYLKLQNDSSREIIKWTKKLGIPKSGLKYRNDISLGDEVYFIGFPYGIGASNIISPIVRSGSIAWISNSSSEFLLDALSFSGNSGSPIFSKTLIKKGKLEWESTKLVGMIIGHHGLKLENILSQPNPDILKFEKGDIDLNFGLARCLYIDDIMKVVNNLKQ